jgi:hypothetical protein
MNIFNQLALLETDRKLNESIIIVDAATAAAAAVAWFV